MDMGIRGKSALISGGSKGVGRAIAELLAAEGALVTIAARGRESVDEVVDAIRAAGGKAKGVVADMTKEDGVAAAVATATETFSPPLIAISNVDTPDARRGSAFRYGFEDASNAEITDAFDTLVMSVVHLTRAVLPAMKGECWGRLINIGSKSMKEPHAPPTQKILSNIGRLGVVGLMKTLCFEYGKYGITANIVATGQIATGLARDAYQARGLSFEEAEQKMREIGLGACRFGRPEEIAKVAVFLCSARASFISGETIGVTGGMQKVLL